MLEEKELNQFIGKKISFQDTAGVKFEGICDTIGYNQMLPSWELQITLDDRTPISNINFKTIKIIE